MTTGHPNIFATADEISADQEYIYDEILDGAQDPDNFYDAADIRQEGDSTIRVRMYNGREYNIIVTPSAVDAPATHIDE